MSKLIREMTIAKTRRRHQCFMCGALVPIGEKMEAQVCEDDGMVYTIHWHPECRRHCWCCHDFEDCVGHCGDPRPAKEE